MDQLKQYMAVVLKYHFWILSGLVTVIFIAAWVLFTMSMSKETAARVGVISTAYTKGEQITQIVNHPNDQSKAMMEQLNRSEAEQVLEAWERRFREQENVLVWPDELRDDFIQAVERLKPIELTVESPTPPDKELKPYLRGRYRDYIQDELPKLADIIGAVWHASRSSPGGPGGPGGYGSGMGGGMSDGSGMGMGSGMGSPGGSGMGPGGDYSGAMGSGGDGSPYGPAARTDEESFVVLWDSTNQSGLQNSRFNWSSPTTLQVLYAQEDLWVLRALMMIVKAVNGDAEAQYSAAIKEIESIQIGPDAAGIKSAGSVSSGGGSGSMYGSSGMGSGSSGSPYGSGSPPGSPYGSGTESPYGSGGATTARQYDPANGRYVDNNYEPMTAERLRTAMKSNQPSDAFLAVAKRMPVRLRFRMNVLKLPVLLAACANSNLPVEVRQVRINPSTSGAQQTGMPGSGAPGPSGAGAGSGAPSPMGAGAGAGGAGASMAAPGDMGGGSPTMGGGGSASGMGGMDGGYGGSAGSGESGTYGLRAAANYESPYDSTVEIYGIIYIYNPVAPEKLGISGEATPKAEEALGTPATDAPAASSDAAATAPAGVTPPPDTGTPAAGDPAAPGAAGPTTEAGTSPPAAAGTTPPAGAGTPPAADAGTTPPAGAGTPPATDAGTTPPASTGTTPPATGAPGAATGT